MNLLTQLHADELKISACKIRDGPEKLLKASSKIYLQQKIMETILSTRLPVESYRGIMNFYIALIPNAPIDEI